MDTGVNPNVQRYGGEPENDLGVPCQAFRVQHGEEVPCDKISAVVIEAGARAQLVFERVERTDGAGELNIRSPCHGWYVDPNQTPPPQSKERTRGDEYHERQMTERDESGERLKESRHKGIGPLTSDLPALTDVFLVTRCPSFQTFCSICTRSNLG